MRFLISTFGSFLGFREFFPVCPPFFKAGAGTRSKITSRCLRSLIGQLSLLLVPNMVLSKINNHKHRTKQTYESYTFQPLMSFCCHLNRNQSKNRTFLRLYKVIKFICSALWAISPTQMTDFPTLLNISTSKIPTLSYT